MAQDQNKETQNEVEGEGSYTATRRYNQHLAEHQQEQDVEQLAERAREAIDGEEGEELKRAEEKGKSGPNAAEENRPERRESQDKA